MKFRELTGDPPPDAEDSAAIRQRVINARERQRQRFVSEGVFFEREIKRMLALKFW